MSAPASIRSATGLFSGVVLLTALVVGLSADGALSGNRGGFSPEIYVMNADGSGQANLTHKARTDDLGPAWSPDGTKIAFASEGDIYVMNADGSGQTRLTHVNDFDVSPDWSPDGSKIAFVGGATDTGFIDVMNADGSGRRRLTNGGSDYFPDWSPDGTKIAYHTGRTGQTNLARTLRSDDFEPAWSPDGTKIPFAGTLDTTAPLLALIARSPQRVLRQKGVIV